MDQYLLSRKCKELLKEIGKIKHCEGFGKQGKNHSENFKKLTKLVTD